MFHLLNGVRHLFWDAGKGFERTQRHASGWFAAAGRDRLDAVCGRLGLGAPVMSLRSPLGRVLGLGSAKDGTAHWWAQRVTRGGAGSADSVVRRFAVDVAGFRL